MCEMTIRNLEGWSVQHSCLYFGKIKYIDMKTVINV